MQAANAILRADIGNSVKVIKDKIPKLNNENKKVVSRLRFLVPEGEENLRFNGTIRMNAVCKEELGALIYALS